MIDITAKTPTHRTATAEGWLVAPPAVVARLKARTLDKGDALEMGRAAAHFAAKRCDDLIPLCHPLPLQRLDVVYEFPADAPGRVRVAVTAGVFASTGVEMEALTGVSLALLTLYDMMKPLAGLNLEITGVRLLEKTGGKQGTLRAGGNTGETVAEAAPGA